MFVWEKIKALKYCLISQYAAQIYSQGCVNVTIAWALGLNSAPIQTVQGLWHLTLHVSQLCTVEKCKKTKQKGAGWETSPKWWVKRWWFVERKKAKRWRFPPGLKTKRRDAEGPMIQTVMMWSPSMLKLQWTLVMFFSPTGLSETVSRFPPSVHTFIPPQKTCFG